MRLKTAFDKRVRDLATWVRAFYRFSLVIIYLVQAVFLVCAVFPSQTVDKRKQTVRIWISKVLNLLGLQITKTEEPALQKGLCIANHTSWLDVLALMSIRPSCFVAKSELAKWPIIGLICQRLGVIFVNRDKRLASFTTIEKMRLAMHSGEVVTFFPEGTTTDGSHLLPFKSTLFESVVGTHLPVQTVAIRYTSAHIGHHGSPHAFVGDQTFVASLWWICKVSQSTVHLMYATPRLYQNLNRSQIARVTQQALTLTLASQH